MSTANHFISSTTKNHAQNLQNLGALAESLAKNTRDATRVARGVNTSVGKVVQPKSLGLTCSKDAWADALGPYRDQVDSDHYLQEAFFLCCHDEKLSLLAINIWRYLIKQAEKQQHLVTVRHRQLQESFNVSESSVRGSLDRLLKEGYLEFREKRYTVDGKVYDLYVSYPARLIPKLKALLNELQSLHPKPQIAENQAHLAETPEKHFQEATTAMPIALKILPEGHKENIDPPTAHQQNQEGYTYLSWSGNPLPLDAAFEQPESIRINAAVDKLTALPEKPYEPNPAWIGDSPREADLAALKSWIDNFEKLFMCRKFEEAKQSLAPYQHKLLDWVSWGNANPYKAPARYLMLIKNLCDEYNISHRRWLAKGDWELSQERKVYEAAIARLNPATVSTPLNGGVEPKPKLSNKVAAHIPNHWYTSIENLLSNRCGYADAKKILELAYHLCYFMPRVPYETEEDRLRINFCVARKHVLAGTWRIPMGLQTQLAHRRVNE